jgi:ribonuclease III
VTQTTTKAATKTAKAPASRRQNPLEKALGYRFGNPELLAVALTHASMRSTGDKPNGEGAQAGTSYDNERLEFLGDRVLGLAIAEMLTKAFPAAEEGELARRYNRLVRREACADVAIVLELGRHLVLSEGEADSGGRSKLTILADACEAVLGAIFLDGGFEPARATVQKLWLPRLATEERDRPDPKSALQEWAQGLGMAIPVYVLTDRKGPDHAPHFTAEVRIPSRKAAAGEGTSKRLAEQAAAAAFLLRERVWQESSDGHQS